MQSIDEHKIMRLDQKKLLTIYHNWPQHFRDALNISCELDHEPKYYKSIILCGMGGSATACDILDHLLYKMGGISTSVVRSHHVPSFADESSLVLVNSVSGNTAESILMAEDAINRNAEVICISSGGRLKEVCGERGCKHLEIPRLSMPRASLPYLLMPGLKIISSFCGASVEQSMISLPDRLLKIATKISLENLEQEDNAARRIADFLVDGFAFCYTSPSLLSAGTRFKNSLNENAKVHCIKESIMEASHNEIVPFTFTENYVAPRILQLRWQYDEIIVRDRFDNVRSLFTKIVQPLMEINITDKDLISAIVSAIYVLDYATIYMALLRSVDPSPTPAIDILKGNSPTRVSNHTEDTASIISV
jgi:glucose/mannose-6-phosphate isomerase